ncbi:uncharacterized protein LOC126906056 [Daktulosphaira vitifoliae]|uniref:uncharacterized protein LOC126906056 n=1 Tax=Daktulosphaira vitifoliae TaxID=58002 RepID=UPI0021A9E5D9|nr:uncharacterized protein LOC126906056 [Daktulosphaira vitifoliae]
MFKTGFIKLDKSQETSVHEQKTHQPERGVVYLSHIPHGFYENEMKQYFSQFGEVTNINIPKSKKTGRARGFGFVEFEYPEVAKVVAETMDNYLMHKKIIKAKYLPPTEVKKSLFKYCNKKQIPSVIKHRSIQRKIMERPLDPERIEKSKNKLEKRLNAIKKKLGSKGIQYDIQVYNFDDTLKNSKSRNSEKTPKVKVVKKSNETEKRKLKAVNLNVKKS